MIVPQTLWFLSYSITEFTVLAQNAGEYVTQFLFTLDH